MTTSDDSQQPAHIDLDSLSLEELELLTERKRQQLHVEAVEKKAQLESEMAGIDQQIQELQARKGELETQHRAVAKALGLPGGGERTARRNPRKSKKPAETEAEGPVVSEE